MRLKLYRAATMAQAMAQLREELGPEALILSSKRVPDGIELTAALDQPDEPPVCHAPAQPPPAPVNVLDASYHAVPAALASRLAGPDLAGRLQHTLRFAPLVLEGAAPLLLAGLPGAGKTLTVARLATRLVLAGTRPLVITADGRRAGGAEELAAYTRLLGLTLLAASTPATLTRALAEAAPGVPVLIDTSGINPFEPGETEQLAALIAAARALPVLVMQAGAHPEEAAEQATVFAGLGITHLLPTRLDIARRLGSVLAVADPAGPGLTLTEAGIGTGATDGLATLTPAFLAERLLRAQPPARHLPPGPDRPAAVHPGLDHQGRPQPSADLPTPPQPSLRAPVFPSARAHAAARNMQPYE